MARSEPLDLNFEEKNTKPFQNVANGLLVSPVAVGRVNTTQSQSP